MKPPSIAARRHAAKGGQFIQTIGRWVVARRTAMIGLFAALTVTMIALGSTTTVAYRILADLTGSEAGDSQRFMEDHMGAVLPMAIDIRLDGDAREPDAIIAIAGFTEWLREQPLVGHASSLSDAVSESWSVLTGQPGTWPDSREATAQSLFAFSMGQDDPVEHLMADDGSRTRIVLRIKDEGGDALNDDGSSDNCSCSHGRIYDGNCSGDGVGAINCIRGSGFWKAWRSC